MSPASHPLELEELGPERRTPQGTATAAAASRPPELKMQRPIIHKRVDRIPGYLAAFTAAAVVEAPPGVVMGFLSSPAEFPRVYSSCRSIEDLVVEEEAPEGQGPRAFRFLMRNVVTVLGLRQSPAMRMRLQADPTKSQVRFAVVQPSGLVKDLQGINAVVPLPPTGTGPCTGLTQQQLADVTAAFVRSLGIGEGAAPAAAAAGGAALPLFASISLAHVLGRTGVPPQPLPAVNAGAEQQEQQRCVVVLHQRIRVKFCPPGMGMLLKGQMLSMHTQNLEDLLSRLGGRAGGSADMEPPS